MELRDRNFILIDIETTGFDEKKHQILEVGILVIKDLKLIAHFEVKIKHREYTITAKAIEANNNSVILALTLFFASLSIISLILGDVLMAIVDPRISFSNSGGGRK